MNSVTLTFYVSGQDYAVDFPDEATARAWYNDSNPLDSTIAKRISMEEADRILGRSEGHEE